MVRGPGANGARTRLVWILRAAFRMNLKQQHYKGLLPGMTGLTRPNFRGASQPRWNHGTSALTSAEGCDTCMDGYLMVGVVGQNPLSPAHFIVPDRDSHRLAQYHSLFCFSQHRISGFAAPDRTEASRAPQRRLRNGLSLGHNQWSAGNPAHPRDNTRGWLKPPDDSSIDKHRRNPQPPPLTTPSHITFLPFYCSQFPQTRCDHGFKGYDLAGQRPQQ